MADDTKTRRQLVEMALEELGAIEAGQPPEAEDYNRVDNRFDGLLAELRKRNVVDVDDEDEIPVEWARSLAILLADENPVPFGKSKMPENERRLVIQRLRSLTSSGTTSETVKTCYF